MSTPYNFCFPLDLKQLQNDRLQLVPFDVSTSTVSCADAQDNGLGVFSLVCMCSKALPPEAKRPQHMSKIILHVQLLALTTSYSVTDRPAQTRRTLRNPNQSFAKSASQLRLPAVRPLQYSGGLFKVVPAHHSSKPERGVVRHLRKAGSRFTSIGQR